MSSSSTTLSSSHPAMGGPSSPSSAAAALEAKIASIRAKNAALEKRHQEVEQDRLSAEKRQSAVQPQNQPPAQSYPHRNATHNSENPHRHHHSHSASGSGSGSSRGGGGGQFRRESAPRSAWRSGDPSEENRGPLRTPTGAPASRPKESQKEGGPPPDPAYRFLADRMRDGSDSDEADGDGGWRHRPSGRGASSRGGPGRGGRSAGRGAPRGSNGSGRGAGRGFPAHEHSERESWRSHPPAPSGGFDHQSERGQRHRGGGAAQARLERARQPPLHASSDATESKTAHQNRGSVSDPVASSPWRCPDPGCGHANPSGGDTCAQCDLKWSIAEDHIARASRQNGQRRVKDDNRNLRVEVKFNRSPTHDDRRGSHHHASPPVSSSSSGQRGAGQRRDSSGANGDGWKAKASPSPKTTPTQWHEAEPYQPKTSVAQVTSSSTSSSGAQTAESSSTWNWRDPNGENVSEWVDPTGVNPLITSDPSQSLEWNQYMDMTEIPADPQSQFMAMPAYPDGGGLAGPDTTGIGGNPHMLMQYHHAQAAAVMAGHHHHHPNNAYIPLPQHHQLPHHQQHGALLGHTPIMTTHHMGMHGGPHVSMRSQYYPPSMGEYSNHANEPGHYSGRRPFSSTPRFETHPRRGNNGEISYIPQRFQKQLPNEGSKQTWNIHKAIAKLPRSSLDTPPSGCDQLLMFVSKSVAECLNAEEMSQELKVKIKMVPVESFEDLLGKMDEFDPAQHRYILFHVLNEDARTISQCGKSDVDKGQDSDNMADNFCDLVENLVRRIAYVTAIVSMLNPRCDFEELNAMSCPNSVRKVINVQLSMRLHEKKNIVSVNNDLVLEWFKDDVKRNRLVKSNGHELTAFGISVMLEQWLTVLKEFVHQVQEVKLVDPVPLILPLELKDVSQETCSEPKEDAAVTPSSILPETLSCSSTTKGGKATTNTPNLASGSTNDQPTAISNEVSMGEGTESNSSLVKLVKPHDSSVREGEFHEMENGGFIEDSYCDNLKANDDDERNLPSLGSITGHHDDDDDDEEGEGGPTSGIFIEDSYVEATSAHGQEEILEKENQEKMEKDFSKDTSITK